MLSHSNSMGSLPGTRDRRYKQNTLSHSPSASSVPLDPVGPRGWNHSPNKLRSPSRVSSKGPRRRMQAHHWLQNNAISPKRLLKEPNSTKTLISPSKAKGTREMADKPSVSPQRMQASRAHVSVPSLQDPLISSNLIHTHHSMKMSGKVTFYPAKKVNLHLHRGEKKFHYKAGKGALDSVLSSLLSDPNPLDKHDVGYIEPTYVESGRVPVKKISSKERERERVFGRHNMSTPQRYDINHLTQNIERVGKPPPSAEIVDTTKRRKRELTKKSQFNSHLGYASDVSVYQNTDRWV